MFAVSKPVIRSKARQVLAAGLICLSNLMPASAATPFQLGVQLYEYGQYAAAVRYFERASQINPANPDVHYWLANSLAYLGRTDDAKYQYQLCIERNPKSIAADYSRLALRYATRRNPGPMLEPDSKDSLVQAVKTIKSQTEENSMRYRQEGMAMSQGAIGKANVASSLIRVHAEEDLNDLRGRMVYWSPILRAQESEIRLQSLVSQRAAQQDARMEAARHMRQATERAKALEDAAVSLESQLAEGPKRYGVRLTAAGTNLYVRNYVSEEAPLVELVATEKALSRNPASNRTVTAVHGQIVGP